MKKRPMTPRRMATRLTVVLVGWTVGLGFPATAADFEHRSRSLEKSAERALERAQAAAPAASAAASAASAPAAVASAPLAGLAQPRPAPASAATAASGPGAKPATVDISLEVGAAWEGNRHTRTRTTPFTFAVDAGNWHGEFNGDGQSRKSGTSPGSGLADISAEFGYQISNKDHPSLMVTPSVQWTFPTGDPAGSRRASQEVSVLLLKQLPADWHLERWYLSVEPFVDRDTEDATATAQYGKSVKVGLKWKKDGDVATSFKITRAHPAGARDKTKFSVVHDFAICPKLDGSLLLARSLQGPDSTSSAEFDLTWSF